MALIVDTGPIVAAINREDVEHARCSELLRRPRERLIVPSPVLVEVDWLIQTRMDPAAMVPFLDDVIAGGFEIENLIAEDYLRMRHLCSTYADSPLGFVDAAVIAVAERRNETKIATLDHRHFRMVRPRHVDAFELLP